MNEENLMLSAADGIRAAREWLAKNPQRSYCDAMDPNSNRWTGAASYITAKAAIAAEDPHASRHWFSPIRPTWPRLAAMARAEARLRRGTL